ncbi:MAG: hypothetical protein AAGD34_11625 [Pseudomonadota bacterium]
MKEPTLYIHAGMHKTGSTAFQKAAARHSDVLRAHGLIYPDLPLPNHSHFLVTQFAGPGDVMTRRVARLRRNGLDAFLDESDQLRASFETYLEKTAGEGHDGIISGEDVAIVGTSGLTELRDLALQHFAKVVVVALVRPPRSFMHSAAQQLIKSGATLTTLAADPPVPGYRGRFGPLIDVFGRDNVRFALYTEQMRQEKAIVPALMDMLDRSNVSLTDLGSIAANVSLPQTAAKLMLMVNGALNRRERPDMIPAPIAEALADGPFDEFVERALNAGNERYRWPGQIIRRFQDVPGPSFRLPADIVEKGLAATTPATEWMSETMGVDINAADDTASPEPGDLSDLSEAEVADIANALTEDKRARRAARMEAQDAASPSAD